MLFITLKSAEAEQVPKVLQVVEETKRIRHKAGICYFSSPKKEKLTFLKGWMKKKKVCISTSFMIRRNKEKDHGLSTSTTRKRTSMRRRRISPFILAKYRCRNYNPRDLEMTSRAIRIPVIRRKIKKAGDNLCKLL